MLNVFAVLYYQRWTELLQPLSDLRCDFFPDELFDGLLAEIRAVDFYLKLPSRQIVSLLLPDVMQSG